MNSVDGYTLWESTAIVDVQIPSHAGTVLSKKCQINLQRATGGRQQGPWVVTEITYLGEE